MAQTLPVEAALVRLSFLVQARYADACARHNLSPVQARLLCMIKDRPRGLTELAQMLGQERPGLSGLVSRVEARGLVRRDTPEHDRRAVTLTLTGPGKDVVEAFFAEVSAQLRQVLGHLPAADRRHFARIATNIVDAGSVPAIFGAADEPAPAGPR